MAEDDKQERDQLLSCLKYQRDSVLAIVHGLAEEHWQTSLAGVSMSDLPKGHRRDSEADAQVINVREVVLHMIEETAAHSGHLEIARELLDGRTGLGLR